MTNPDGRHPYRDAGEALSVVTAPVFRVRLRDLRAALDWLQYEADCGNLEHYFVGETRQEVAGWMRSMRRSAEVIKNTADPVAKLLAAVAAMLTGYGFLAGLSKVAGGPYLIVAALAAAVFCGLAAEWARRWLLLATQVEAVVVKLSKVAETKPAHVVELATQQITEGLLKVARQSGSGQTGVRIASASTGIDARHVPQHDPVAAVRPKLKKARRR